MIVGWEAMLLAIGLVLVAEIVISAIEALADLHFTQHSIDYRSRTT